MAELLFDPQTAGGLLATVPDNSLERTQSRLREAGEPATCIGEIRKGGPRILVE